MSKIISISATVHDCGVAYMVDGEIICAFEEERFKRLKGIFNQFAYPELSLKALEENYGVTPLDDDIIVVMPKPVVCGLEQIRKILQVKEIYLFEHHDCHSATAYFLSGFDCETLVLTIDAGDSNGIPDKVLNLDVFEKILSQNLPYRKLEVPEDEYIEFTAKAKQNKGDLPYQLWYPESSYFSSDQLFYDSCVMSFHSAFNGKIQESNYVRGTHTIATFWDFYCGINGLFGGKDEGKIVGLAAQGNYNEDIFSHVGECFLFNGDPIWKQYSKASEYFSGLDLQPGSELRKDSAYMVQMLSENYVLELVEWIKEKYPNSRKLALSGGLFSNVKINQKLNEFSPFEEIFIAPGMGDGGLALGACLCKANELGEFFPKKISNVFWGLPTKYDFTVQDLEITEFNPELVANMLAQGKVLGIFSNSREWGPRSLGATSIIYDPSDKNGQAYINSRLNRNDEMPFAPIVLEGFESQLFHCYKSKYASKFMTICYDVKDEWVEKIPGVINKYDNTSRIQIVDESINPFHPILNAFYNLTKIPALMNTSFNVHGEPIINTVDQALNHLRSGVVDYLIVGEKIYSKPKYEIEKIFEI